MLQISTEFTVGVICGVQWFISAVNILGIKCTKVIDFLKSSHILRCDIVSCTSKKINKIYNIIIYITIVWSCLNNDRNIENCYTHACNNLQI